MHKPTRMCSVCRKKGEKELFIRVAKNKDGEFLIDYSLKADGRGAYVCKNIACIQSARAKKVFERSFKMKIDTSVYDELERAASENDEVL